MPLALEVGGPGPGPHQVHWPRVGGGNSRRVPPDPPIPKGPFPLAFLLLHMAPPCLLEPCGQRRPQEAEDQAWTPTAGGGLAERRTSPRSPAGFLGPEWARETLSALPADPTGSPGSPGVPVWELLPPPSHPSGAPVLSGLHFSSSLTPPMSYPVTQGFLPVSLGIKVPTSVRRCPSFGEMQTPHLPMPPS